MDKQAWIGQLGRLAAGGAKATGRAAVAAPKALGNYAKANPVDSGLHALSGVTGAGGAYYGYETTGTPTGAAIGGLGGWLAATPALLRGQYNRGKANYLKGILEARGTSKGLGSPGVAKGLGDISGSSANIAGLNRAVGAGTAVAGSKALLLEAMGTAGNAKETMKNYNESSQKLRDTLGNVAGITGDLNKPVDGHNRTPAQMFASMVSGGSKDLSKATTNIAGASDDVRNASKSMAGASKSMAGLTDTAATMAPKVEKGFGAFNKNTESIAQTFKDTSEWLRRAAPAIGATGIGIGGVYALSAYFQAKREDARRKRLATILQKVQANG